jgi:hypothetical protein
LYFYCKVFIFCNFLVFFFNNISVPRNFNIIIIIIIIIIVVVVDDYDDDDDDSIKCV